MESHRDFDSEVGLRQSILINTESCFVEAVDAKITNVIKSNISFQLKEMIEYHFSVLGKRIRPRMVYGLGKSFNVSTSSLISWAACCEILHNATLVHDDLQDGDHLRRGVPTVWKKFGHAEAINLGDFLLLRAPLAYLTDQLSSDIKTKLSFLYSEMASSIVDGQSREFYLNTLDSDDLEKDYFECISGKTSALFAGQAKGVGVILGLSEETISSLSDLLHRCGNLFQIQDDLLDLYGNKGRDEVGCDLKEGKVSFLIVSHLKRHSEDFELLKKILKKKRNETTAEDIHNVKKLFVEKRTLLTAIEYVDSLTNEILSHSLVETYPELKSYLSYLIGYMLKPIKHLNLSKGL